MIDTGIYNDSKWIGMKYNMLTVIKPVHVTLSNGCNQWFWKVKCDCGNEKVYKPIEIIKGRIVSCGCYKKTNGYRTKRHGESHTRLHNIWCGIIERCTVGTNDAVRYGNRGIAVCEAWKRYEAFADWARSNGYNDSLTIERIDVNGNYCPENCKWIEHAKQARNRRTTHWVEYNGKKMSLAEACERANLPYKQVFERIAKYGWPVEKALMTPIRKCVRKK